MLGVEPGKLVHHQDETRPILQQRVADQRLMALDHLGRVAERDRGAVHRHAGEILRRGDRRLMADVEPLVGGIDEAPGPRRGRIEVGQRRCPHRLAGGLDDLGKGYSLLAHGLGIDDHLELLIALPPDCHVGDAGHAQQPGHDRPAGHDRQLDQ